MQNRLTVKRILDCKNKNHYHTYLYSASVRNKFLSEWKAKKPDNGDYYVSNLWD